jgi:hypothetical protein
MHSTTMPLQFPPTLVAHASSTSKFLLPPPQRQRSNLVKSYTGCDDKGDDRGLTTSYNYNLNVTLPEDDRTPEYFRNITSWRC